MIISDEIGIRKQLKKVINWTTDFVEMFESQDNLSDIDANLLLGKLLSLVQMSEQLTAAHIICSQSFNTFKFFPMII